MVLLSMFRFSLLYLGLPEELDRAGYCLLHAAECGGTPQRWNGRGYAQTGVPNADGEPMYPSSRSIRLSSFRLCASISESDICAMKHSSASMTPTSLWRKERTSWRCEAARSERSLFAIFPAFCLRIARSILMSLLFRMYLFTVFMVLF